MGGSVSLAVRELCGRGAVGLSRSTAGLFEAYTLLLPGHPSPSPLTFDFTLLRVPCSCVSLHLLQLPLRSPSKAAL